MLKSGRELERGSEKNDMGIFDRFKKREKASPVGIWLGGGDDICCPGYTSLDHCPEILAACNIIAELIASVTIHLMENTKNGDVRIENELSRKIDIDPEINMTRFTWMHGIMMDLQLYGSGNAIVIPHTYKGYLQSLEPIAASRVSFDHIGYRDYRVVVDGKRYDPDNVLHFVMNPDKTYKWKGQGYTIVLRDLARNLKQAAATERAFMESKWKPTVIVKVDAFTEEFSDPSYRRKMLDEYVRGSEAGEPWVVPAEQFQVEQIKPLSLKDLAIDDTVKLDRRMVAALIGIPAFLLGVGEYNQGEYNSFIQGKIMSLVKSLMQEMTKKLIMSDSWYLQGNVWSLMDYDIEKVSRVLLSGADRGYVNGDEWRDRMHMSPAGLDEFKILENYIPYDMSGFQKKLEGESNG